MRIIIIALFAVASCDEIRAVPGDDAGAGPVVDAGTPDVPMQACTADSRYCGNASAVYLCDSDGASGVKVQDCDYGCAAGACNACVPGTTFCNGDGLSSCDSSGNISDTTSCMGHGCQMGRCNTCTPNENSCSTGSTVPCSADGTPGDPISCGPSGCTDGICNACTPSTTSCQGDTLVVCDAGGAVASGTLCALGCSTSGAPHCRSLTPSYGTGAPAGVDAFDLDINNSAVLDISNCTNTPSSVALTIGATRMSIVGSPQIAVVSQVGAPLICVVKFHNVVVQPGKVLTIKNSSTAGQVLALEAEGTMNIQGLIAFRSSAAGLSTGGNTTQPASSTVAPGAGGGGNAYAGGAGGACVAPGCGTTTVSGGVGGGTLSPSTLHPGGKGGTVLNSSGGVVASGGFGGGGLQLIALQSITIGTLGRIDINGLGGSGLLFVLPGGGGGAGGTLVIDTPLLTISQGAILAANGGGGAGGCSVCVPCSHANGQPGQLSAVRATGGACASGGNGGFAANGVTNPSSNGQKSTSGKTVAGGGGGGGDGYIILHTRDAAHLHIASGSTISPGPITDNVIAN